MVLLKNSSRSVSSPEDTGGLFQLSLPGPSILQIRALTIDDLNLQCEWMYCEFKGALGLGSMEGLRRSIQYSFEAMALSDIGNSFMVLLDNDPACIVEVTRANFHTVFTQYSFLPGDHFISVVYAPGKEPTPGLLQAVNRFFFSYSDVNRLLINVFDNQCTLKHNLEDAGFRYLGPWHETTGSHMTSLYYAC